jgi:hypothetical protein
MTKRASNWATGSPLQTWSATCPDFHPGRQAGRVEYFASGEAVKVDTLHRRKDGTRTGQVTSYAQQFGEQQVLIAFYADITERKHAET